MPASPRSATLCLLAGLAAGFLGAVWAGHQAASYSKPANFRRFHQAISPEGAFYPPFAMLENLALARWRPGLTVVIIGGNSILNGVGQPEDELWSSRLQYLLGERYVVVNLSFRGAWPSEGGALVAEALLQRGIPVVYVANGSPGPVARAYEGAYGYLFWDARSQDRLLANPARETELNLRLDSPFPSVREPLRAQESAAALNHTLRFRELWHHVAYRHFSTVWTIPTREHFWLPRRARPDNEPPAPPLGERYRHDPETEMIITRGFSAPFVEADGQGGWRVLPGPFHQARIDIDEVFCPPLRPRMLMLLSQNSPHYRDLLPPAERARDEFSFAAYQQLWRDLGIACVTTGADFTAADYRDRTHLSPEGGRKLATLVAAEITRLSPP